jgi:hypothetical protein
LSTAFRRDIAKHKYFFHAVANIVQMGLMTGEYTVFDIHDSMPKPEGWW